MQFVSPVIIAYRRIVVLYVPWTFFSHIFARYLNVYHSGQPLGFELGLPISVGRFASDDTPDPIAFC